MSLNGDVVVMRNGRSASQVSVYNYPEHLNPFYEDDQHKRLRFWKFNKKSLNEGRRNSFSISNLRDIWAFKSFSTKKKSSTLGINKTSESPPLLRRQLNGSSTAGNEFLYSDDRRLRYTPTPSESNFDRNATYRSSYQNVNSNSQDYPKEFNRNDQYRNTTNFAGTTFNGQRLIRKPYHSNTSSQTSLNSTNPFESEDECINAEKLGDTPNKVIRKKRKAPAPPVPIHAIENNNNNNKDHIESSQQNSLHIDENEIEIANLTAEIENFVNSSSNDVMPAAKQVELNDSKESNQTAPNASKQIEHKDTISNKIETNVETIECKQTSSPRSKTTTVLVNARQNEPKHQQAEVKKETDNHISNPIIITQPHTTFDNSSQNLEQPELETAHQVKNTNKNISEIGHVECIHVHVPNQRTTPDRIVANNVSSFQSHQTLDNANTVTKNTYFTLAQPLEANQTNKRESNNLPCAAPRLSVNKVNNDDLGLNEANGLKIQEKQETSSTKPALKVKPILKKTNFADIHKPTTGVNPAALTTPSPVLIEPLKIVEKTEEERHENTTVTSKTTDNVVVDTEFHELFRAKPIPMFEWKKSTLAPLETHIPPEKRKSVKDIIESINRSQQLLKANGAHSQKNGSITEDPNQSKCSTSRDVVELDDNSKQVITVNQEENVLDNIAQSNQKPNNGDVFQKCKINKVVCQYRESSPTSSNLDWNPLPKPKRTKNLSDV